MKVPREEEEAPAPAIGQVAGAPAERPRVPGRGAGGAPRDAGGSPRSAAPRPVAGESALPPAGLRRGLGGPAVPRPEVGGAVAVTAGLIGAGRRGGMFNS